MDTAIITVIPEEYHAVLETVENAQFVPPGERPNTYAWKAGRIGRSSVVVGLVGRAGTTPCALAISEAYVEFRPQSMVLLGVAGGMHREGQGVGDIVISDTIWFYEYGKVEDGFRPRIRYVYQVDPTLFRSAIALKPPADIWTDSATQDLPPPQVRSGTVASGNKVIDNIDDPIFRQVLAVEPKILAVEMEAAGAADAIDELRSRGATVRFIMLRGISDMPASGATAVGQQTTQRDTNKPAAARAAARFLKFWLETDWPLAPESAKSARLADRRKEVRALLEKKLPTDDLFQQFCIEHFPNVAAALSSGMSLKAKQNYLFQAADPSEIERELQRFTV